MLWRVPIRTKRWNDAPEPEDGLRVLVCRYRPRGVRKDQEPWDAWMEDLGPSRELHAAFYGKEEAPIDWPEYRRRYLDEMMQTSGRGAAMLVALAGTVCANPEGLAMDSYGNFYTASDVDGATTGTICVFSPSGTFTRAISIPPGPAGVAPLVGMLFEEPRTLFVADTADGNAPN